MTKTKTCRNPGCHEPVTSKRHDAHFCSSACRKAFNNTRAVRGAQLYDAFLAMRYDRKQAEALGIDWTLLSRMGEAWFAEDGGEASWRDPREFKDEHGPRFNARPGHFKIGRSN